MGLIKPLLVALALISLATAAAAQLWLLSPGGGAFGAMQGTSPVISCQGTGYDFTQACNSQYIVAL